MQKGEVMKIEMRYGVGEDMHEDWGEPGGWLEWVEDALKLRKAASVRLTYEDGSWREWRKHDPIAELESLITELRNLAVIDESLIPELREFLSPRCLRCLTKIVWIECPTGGWWAHAFHPSDGHDAVSLYPRLEEQE